MWFQELPCSQTRQPTCSSSVGRLENLSTRAIQYIGEIGWLPSNSREKRRRVKVDTRTEEGGKSKLFCSLSTQGGEIQYVTPMLWVRRRHVLSPKLLFGTFSQKQKSIFLKGLSSPHVDDFFQDTFRIQCHQSMIKSGVSS